MALSLSSMQVIYYLQNPPPSQHSTTPYSTAIPSTPKLHATNLSRAVPSLLRLASAGTASVHLTRVSGVEAAVLDRGGISVVGVDARELAAVLGNHALNVHITLALGRALFAVSVDWSSMHRVWLG